MMNPTHPLINNSNQYVLEKKYVSIHSEDRDILKYPNSSEFEITLPSELTNVVTARLSSWSFPANYNVFSISLSNITLTFKITSVYRPQTVQTNIDLINDAIYNAISIYGNDNFIIEIESGFYNPNQMVVELSNKMNNCVTRIIREYLDNPVLWDGKDYTTIVNLFRSYDRFKVVYNTVSQKIWFGNTSDQFILTNTSQDIAKKFITDPNCIRKGRLPEFVNWGLPPYLGFDKIDATSYNVQEYIDNNVNASVNISLNKQTLLPRFFYGDAVPNSGDSGYWLYPLNDQATVYFLESPNQIAFMGPGFMYMEIEGMNCIDETSPFGVNNYTISNSNTVGVARAAFAKIPIPSTPISQWFDGTYTGPCKYWNPPAERISKLKIKIRYHNNSVVTFGKFEYSFNIEFAILRHQQLRSMNVQGIELAQHQKLESFI